MNVTGHIKYVVTLHLKHKMLEIGSLHATD